MKAFSIAALIVCAGMVILHITLVGFFAHKTNNGDLTASALLLACSLVQMAFCITAMVYFFKRKTGAK